VEPQEEGGLEGLFGYEEKGRRSPISREGGSSVELRSNPVLPAENKSGKERQEIGIQGGDAASVHGERGTAENKTGRAERSERASRRKEGGSGCVVRRLRKRRRGRR